MASRLLKNLRSRTKLRSKEPQAETEYHSPPSIPTYRGRDHTQRLPEKVLANIFSFVCPHTQDFSYEPSEQSQIGDGCMLCDLRDLARCAQVCRKWYSTAQRVLYTSIRIDAVHYCALEEELADKRKKSHKSFRRQSPMIDPGEIPTVRLSLLCRTVREQDRLAQQVLILKLPYMTRETAKGELARCVSALPNLQYVDLPEGFYTGDPSCTALRQELQVCCPDIRKMSYKSGSEEALELLTQRHWQHIEILELSGLALQPATLRIVLASLPTLHQLTLRDLPWLSDDVFQTTQGLPDFPPLHSLRIESCPLLTALGLTNYLEVPQNREVLSSLSLKKTGVTVQDLHLVLWKASHLEHLSITEVVSRSLGLDISQLPPLASLSLQTLQYEITSSEEVHRLQKPAESYYGYLANSLHQNALPGLTTLYVREPNFPELLILPPINAPFAASSENGSLRSKPSTLSVGSSINAGPQLPANSGFNQTLEIFSKGMDEIEWVFTTISPPANTGAGGHGRALSASGGRPLSALSAERGLGPQWAQGGFGGEARKSVMVGNGFGGFLAVPQEQVPRPLTSDGSAGRFDGTGGTRWGSVGSTGSHNSSRSSFLKPPAGANTGGGGQSVNMERRGSRQDLWR